MYNRRKYKILDAYENGYVTMQQTLTKYSISEYAFYDWKYKYSKYGIDGLKESRTCKKYSNELKELAIEDYISGKFLQSEVVKLFLT
ncbi:helix-turn-helix domain-containing protein [Clostridium algoriphilum]|uniref:helix-turn-helix domain-containing protein n=1 Tax=Clostridium algoriphilum TaxID=198347 RepID=UPI001CF54B5F|nr:helix-turn-helix domain-containing protein [Clostridium algoriphilum]MCB2294450.1 helix-turn-helix domain-containing protein [Clostridium algoriphilum]